MGEWLSAWVSGGIAGPHKLDSLQCDPGLVRGAVEPTMLHNLTQEGDDALCTCREKQNFNKHRSYMMNCKRI